MSSTYGENLKISIFGQSHSEAIGVVIDGLPAGFEVDMDELGEFLARRAPGQGKHTTSRKEPDRPEFLSGLAGGKTCGAPLAAVIRNTNTRSSDYDNIRDGLCGEDKVRRSGGRKRRRTFFGPSDGASLHSRRYSTSDFEGEGNHRKG